MVICHANSGQTKIDHFKFTVELVQALLMEHESESVRKIPQTKMCRDFLKDIFQNEYQRQKKGQAINCFV